MKIGSGNSIYGGGSSGNAIGYSSTASASRHTKLSAHKNGYTPLKASTPRGYGISGAGGGGSGSVNGSDKESLSGRSRKGKYR